MALTQTQVSQLYVSIFNRASEGEGNKFWQTAATKADAANSMLDSQPAKDYFGTAMDDNKAFIEHIYKNTLNKEPADDEAGIKYWVDALNAGLSRGEVVASLIDAIEDHKDSTNPKTKAAYDQFNNRVDVSNYMANTVEKAPADYKTTTAFATSGTTGLVVTNSASTVTTAKNSVQALAIDGSTFTLTASTTGDSFVGTEKNDLFISANGTLSANDTILDSSTTDADIMNIETTSSTGVAARIQNVETINANGTYVAVGYDATNTAGTKNLNLSTSIVGGTATVDGASSINVANINAGTNISILDVKSAAGGTRDVVNVDGGAATTVNVSGIASGIDKYNITVADKATLNVNSLGSLSEYTANVGATATIAATGGKNTKTFTINAAKDSVVTANAVLTDTAANFGNTDFNGAGNVTLKVAAAATALNAQSMTSTGTGTLTVEAAGAAAVNDDYSNIKADTLKLTTAQNAAFTVNENTVVNLADTAGSTGAATIDVDNGTSTSIAPGAGTLNVNVSQSQATLTTGAAVGTLLLKATPDAATDTDGTTITIGNLVANAKTVVVSGSEALTLSNVTHAGDLVITSTQLTGKLVVTNTASTANKDLTIIGGTNDDKVTVTVTAATAATSDTNNIILAGAGNDTITIKGTAAATFNNIIKAYGEDGDDTINASNLSGTAKEIILDGGAGNDTITGSALVDTIVGGAGNDTINGGAGADKITLGAGNDTVIMDGVTANAGDIIADAVIGEDTIVLRGTGVNTAALDVTALTVSSGNYAAKLGADHAFTLTGSTATNLSGLVQFGDATTAYTAAAFALTTGSKNDVVIASTANVNLGAGDDKITTSVDMGTATLTGGAGSDTFNIANVATITDFGAGDVLNMTAATAAVKVTVVESFTAAATTVNAGTGTILTLNQGVDIDMTLATVADAANGYTFNTQTAGDYKLTDGATIVGSVGEDKITGSDFADIIKGGEGADTITGGKGNDTINLAENAAAVDTVVFEASAALNGTDTITGFAKATDIINLKAFATAGGGAGAEAAIVAGAMTTTANTVYQLGGLAAGSADSLSAAAAAITAGATWTAANATAWVILSDDNSTSIYEWADIAGTNGAQVGELTLVGTIDAAMTTAEIVTATTIA